VKTYVYQSVTLTSYTNGEGERATVSSPFGPVRAGLTTTHVQETTRGESLVQLTELLNYLEKKVQILENKSSKALFTFLQDTTHLVEPSLGTTDITGTK
jgi:hypothetical protein